MNNATTLPDGWDDADYSPQDALRYARLHDLAGATAELLITRDGPRIRWTHDNGDVETIDATVTAVRNMLGY